MRKTRVVWECQKSEVENARRKLPAMAAKFIKKGNRLVSRKIRPEELHPFRLEAKRFRYTLELFESFYGPGFQERLEALRKIQNHLGDINDCVATHNLLTMGNPRRLGLKEVLAFLDRRAAKKVDGFRECWEEHFAALGRKAWWIDYLSRFAGRRGSRPAG